MIRVKRVHFVGIGGSGMSGIAEILLAIGYEVSGSDLSDSPSVERLRSLGALIEIGHRAENVEAAGGLGASDACVFTSAAAADNPEILAAHRLRIPVIPRAEMLAEVARLKHTVAVGGTHGKTTTTTMTAAVLEAGGLDPTVIVGGRLPAVGSGARPGKGPFFVVEADESDGSFLQLSPTVAVATNIDDDHLDHHGSMENLEKAFAEFLGSVPFYGFSVVSGGDERLARLAEFLPRRVFTYGIETGRGTRRDLLACDLALEATASFRLERDGTDLGRVRLAVPGRHNVENALAAALVGLELGVSPEAVRAGLEAFRGVGRRLEERGVARGVRVVDDYGHHPTEVRAVLEALRATKPKRILVVFQPHRFTRTRLLADNFSDALSGADRVLLLPIYPAGEAPIPGVDRSLILNGLLARKASADGVEESEVAPRIAAEAREGDTVLLLGAGSVTRLAPGILEALSR